jgi:hypothetical protein
MDMSQNIKQINWMNKRLKLTVNSSGINIQWLANISFRFSKMSKTNVEPTQPELIPQQYSRQYIKLSTHLHPGSSGKNAKSYTLFPFTPLWHAEGSLYLVLHTCLVSSAETCRTKSICYGNWHCHCRKVTEQVELWKIAVPSPPLYEGICTAFLWNTEILQCNVHKQTNKILYFTWQHKFKASKVVQHFTRKVLRPASSTQVFLGFPGSKSKCRGGSQLSRLWLHASHVALPT